MRRELKTLMTEQQQAGTRALSDMDARMNAVKQRMATLEDALDAKVASVSYLAYLPPPPPPSHIISFLTRALSHMGLIMRKPVLGVSDKVRVKPAFSATETS